MKKHPMLFSSEMVDAIKNKTKTETRRILKSPNEKIRYSVGDLIYVRESIYLNSDTRDFKYSSELTVKQAIDLQNKGYKKIPSIHMKKEYSRFFLEITSLRKHKIQEITRSSSIAEGIKTYTMRRNDDVEGIRNEYHNYSMRGVMGRFINPIHSFKSLWKSIYGDKSWYDNPWVIAIEFKSVKRPEKF